VHPEDREKMEKKTGYRRIILSIVLALAVASAGIFVGRWTISNVCAEVD
jgi:hypothetical protein